MNSNNNDNNSDTNDDDNMFAIKCSLTSICNNSLLIEKINKLVFNSNVIINNAYIFLNYHVMKLLNADTPPEIININQTMLYNICQLVTSIKGNNEVKCKDAALLASFTDFKNLYPYDYDFPYRDYCGSIISYIAKEVVVSIMKHLEGNLYNRLRKYLIYI